MPIELKPTGCCGLIELNMISDLKTPEEVIEGMWALWFKYIAAKKPFILFSGVVKRGDTTLSNHATKRNDNYGEALAAHIRRMGYGKVFETDERANTSYRGNIMKVWVWAPDWDAMGYSEKEAAWKKKVEETRTLLETQIRPCQQVPTQPIR